MILNTHHLHFAKQCDNIILMDAGKIIDTGTYKHLFVKYPHVFEKILKEVKDLESKTGQITEEII